jgi:hypothetical protein
MGRSEGGIGNAEGGIRRGWARGGLKMGRLGEGGGGEGGMRNGECGIGTRRRPIGRDYAAATDAASGLSEL